MAKKCTICKDILTLNVANGCDPYDISECDGEHDCACCGVPLSETFDSKFHRTELWQAGRGANAYEHICTICYSTPIGNMYQSRNTDGGAMQLAKSISIIAHMVLRK